MPAVALNQNNEILTPTEEAYGSFYEAFRIFNEALFEGELPNCLIAMRQLIQRRSRCVTPARFAPSTSGASRPAAALRGLGRATAVKETRRRALGSTKAREAARTPNESATAGR